jgi:iron complex outermembrane receptor protein
VRFERRFHFTSGAVGAFSSLLLAVPVFAQTAPLARLNLQELGNIEVTAVSKEPETLRRTPASIYVITQEDIRRSGATTLPEVLRMAPGVEVSRIDSDHWSVGIRGFGDQFSKSVLVLIDGRNVYTPLFAGIYWGVQDTLLDDIERIEVIRGPGGTIWGANAVNGVINVITKSSKDTSGVLATAGTGSTDRGIGQLRYGGEFGQAVTYRLYGKALTRQPEFHTDGQAFDDWRMGQFGFRSDWTSAGNTVTIQGDTYKGTEGQSVTFGSFAPPSDITSYAPLQVSGGNVVARWRHSLSHESDVQLQAYYDRTSMLGPQLGETRNTVDVDFLHHLGSLPRQNLRWGLGMRRSPSEFTQTVSTLDLMPHNRTDSIYSAFIQDEIALIRNQVWLTAGMKIEHNNYTGPELQPSARILWTPTPRQSVWAAVTRAVRTPSELEASVQLTRFLASSPLTYLQVVGSSSFQAERVMGYEAGYRISPNDQFFMDVAAFHNRHDDLESFGSGSVAIVRSPAPAHVLFILPYANGAAGTSDGLELTPDWKPTRWGQLKGSYSYAYIDVQNASGAPDPLKVIALYNGSTPRHQIVVQPQITLPAGWEIDQMYRYASALPARAAAAYVTLDLRIARQFNRHFEVSLVGQNLLQDHHVEFGHDPGPSVAIERSVFATVRWQP